MTEQERSMRAVVGLVCDALSDEELAVLNNVAQLDMNPQGRLFDYQKVASLFTEHNGTRMHEVTKEALAAIVMGRLR